MEVNKVVSKVKEYAVNQIEIMAKTNPLIGFTKPLIVRIIDNNTDKAEKAISILADSKGNIDVENILPEMINSVMTTEPFTIHTSIIGDVNIGGGRIILNLPFTDKNIVFNTEDLENLKRTLIENK